MVYITDFVCTYKMMESDVDKDSLYKLQLLQAFNIDAWNDKIMMDTIDWLYELICHDEHFRRILDNAKISTKLGKVLSVRYTTNTEEEIKKIDSVMFILLFNYDYFELLHKCLCEFFNNDRQMKRETFETIMEKLVVQ
jgi:hypothetical protein